MTGETNCDCNAHQMVLERLNRVEGDVECLKANDSVMDKRVTKMETTVELLAASVRDYIDWSKEVMRWSTKEISASRRETTRNYKAIAIRLIELAAVAISSGAIVKFAGVI